MDYTTLTAAIDFSDVLPVLGVAGVALLGVLIARKGIRYVLGFVK
jgi:hypothetical protein